MAKTRVCVLEDGKRIKYGLLKRPDDTFYFARFLFPDGKRKERSTGETSQSRAELAAAALIRDAYTAQEAATALSWDKAEDAIKTAMKADNLRHNTIKTYLATLTTVRQALPEVKSPTDITPALAERYKLARLKKRKPRTVAKNLHQLAILWRRWFAGLKLVDASANPWLDVKPPKLDALDPRLVTDAEFSHFLNWLGQRWDGWRLPLLFLEVKASIGCRIFELASLTLDRLEDGRAVFSADTAKGRKTRRSKLPPDLFAELKKCGSKSKKCGSALVWGTWSDELRAIHKRRGRLDHAASIGDTTPERIVAWLEDQQQAYFAANPGVKRFKLHNLRGRAMSAAKALGVPYDAAALTFGCHPETMRRHYVVLDETAIADEVFERLHAKRNA